MKKMKKGAAVTVLVIFLAIIVALGYYTFTIIKSTGIGKDRNIKLGLDLAGGVSITYQAKGKTPTDTEMKDTIYKLQQRIENDLGSDTKTTEANVYQVGSDRIAVEIPGVSDANKILEELGTPGDLYFIAETDSDGNENYSYDQATGQYQLTSDIDTLKSNGSIVITGSDVKSATAAYETNQTTNAQDPVVQITLNKKGTKAFAEATKKAYAAGESIGIYYDGKFVSVPKVTAEISDGNCVIEGMEDFDAASNLASYIRIGGLDIQLEELQSEVVGAQLGSNALKSSLIAGIIGILIVFVFMIIMYRIPGLIADLALVLYTELTFSIIYLFDITLTLPGIAGIILSIGMAVDANVIIFTRIKEELTAGKTVIHAAGEGFSKALSAIIDGNVTTLIAAAVLGIMGSGTVKGFAITLALGVILSLFTALFVTKLIMRCFISLGCENDKYYGHVLKMKSFDFIGHTRLFFAISIIVILCGIVSMIGYAIAGKGPLNYSLEFKGGTETTATFDKDYTIAEIDSDIVPVIQKVTGDTDVQTQKVTGSNAIKIKTRTLDLDEREKLNTALKDNFGIDEKDISSENISSTISGETRKNAIIAVLVAVFFMLIYIWIRFKDIRFASSAIIALGHDVLVTLTMYAVIRLSVGSAFIACILTVIGYSINDTIVIFDRIRENAKEVKKETPETLKSLSNNSIMETLSRSLSTSFTTAVTVLMLLMLGVSTVRAFALPLLVGVVCGTYSSICIATELWYIMKIKIKSKNSSKKSSSSKKKPAPKAAVKGPDGAVV